MFRNEVRLLHTYRERHNEFLAKNFTKLVQKSVWSELFRFLPNFRIHVHTIQVRDNLQYIMVFI